MQTDQQQVTGPPKRRFEALTSMRFIAASCIVVMHMGNHFGFRADMTLSGKLPWHQAVSFFFVLSGFILTHAYPALRTRPELRRFFVARLARVWPGHLFALLMWLWLATWVGLNIFATWRQLLANVTMTHAWIPRAKYYNSGNIVSWSISTEFGFYLLFPLLLLRLRRHWVANALATLGLSIILMTLAQVFSLPYDSRNGITTNGLLYMHPLARLFEFACGMAGCLLFKGIDTRYRVRPWIATLVEVCAVVAVALCARFSHETAAFICRYLNLTQPVMLWLFSGGLMAIPFTILIFVFALGRGWISRAFSVRWMVVLGEASYSIYLLHFTLISFFYYKFEASGTNPKLALTAYLLALPVVSIGSWMYIETPLRKWIAAKFGTRHRSQPAASLPTSALP